MIGGRAEISLGNGVTMTYGTPVMRGSLPITGRNRIKKKISLKRAFPTLTAYYSNSAKQCQVRKFFSRVRWVWCLPCVSHTASGKPAGLNFCVSFILSRRVVTGHDATWSTAKLSVPTKHEVIIFWTQVHGKT